jgi:hypothetical protein
MIQPVGEVQRAETVNATEVTYHRIDGPDAIGKEREQGFQGKFGV